MLLPSKKTKSKLLLTPLFIKLNLPLKLYNLVKMLEEEKLILKNSLLISKSNSLSKKKLGNYLENLMKLSKMLKTILLPKKLSMNKKLTEETLNSLILIGLLTSSWNKLLPSVPLSEKELMTTSMMKDLMICSPERVTKTLKLGADQIDPLYFD